MYIITEKFSCWASGNLLCNPQKAALKSSNSFSPVLSTSWQPTLLSLPSFLPLPPPTSTPILLQSPLSVLAHAISFFIKLNLDSHVFPFPTVHLCISSRNQHSFLLRKVGGCRLSLFNIFHIYIFENKPNNFNSIIIFSN